MLTQHLREVPPGRSIARVQRFEVGRRLA
ncbi:hypothetical protein [Nocardioides albus]|nr:hypothetical protein [Nocardioides albus]